MHRAKAHLKECNRSLTIARAVVAKMRANPPRKKAAMPAHLVNLRVATNKFEREQRKVRKARAALRDAEEQTSGVWHTVLQDAARATESATMQLIRPGPSPPVTAAIIRMIKHVESLFDKDQADMTAMEAYAQTWREQLLKVQHKVRAHENL